MVAFILEDALSVRCVYGRFYTKDAFIYPSGRTQCANICSSSGYACALCISRQYKDGQKTHYASGRTFLRLERRTTKGTSSGHIMRFVPVFIQEARKSRRTTKLFAQVRPNGQCVLSLIKAANQSSSMCYPSVSDGQNVDEKMISGKNVHFHIRQT